MRSTPVLAGAHRAAFTEVVTHPGGGGAEWVAHVGLLVNFLGTGPCLAIGDELFGSEVRVLGTVDDVEEAEFDGVGHGDAEV